jgi:hypothetical protein
LRAFSLSSSLAARASTRSSAWQSATDKIVKDEHSLSEDKNMCGKKASS